MVVDKNTDEIEALAKNEENIAELYRKYGDRFPDYKDFWDNLVAEELEHADKLRTLLKNWCREWSEHYGQVQYYHYKKLLEAYIIRS